MGKPVQPWFRRFTRAVEPASPRFDESEVQRYTATPSSMLAMGATISGGGKHKKAKASAATAAAAPTAMAPSPFVQPSVVQAIQGVQQVCSSSTVVSAGSTVRLNRLHRLQPCTVEHTFLHTESRSPTSAVHLPPCFLCS